MAMVKVFPIANSGLEITLENFAKNEPTLVSIPTQNSELLRPLGYLISSTMTPILAFSRKNFGEDDIDVQGR